MNLAPITATTAPPPADAPRSGEPAQAGEFSGVLSQQQGQVRERGAATTHATPKTAETPATAEERDTPAPDETLALLAAGAVLPLMMARTELTGTAASQRGTHVTGTTHAARTAGSGTDAARAILATAQALISDTTAPQSPGGVTPITATERQVASVAGHQATFIPLIPTQSNGDQAASPSPRARATLTPTITAAQLAARPDGARPDTTQAISTQVAAAMGLHTQPTSFATATSAIDSRAIQDVANAMAGATQALGSGTTLSTTTPISSPAVATPLSNPAWAADFSRQFVSMTQGRDMSQPHTIELRLDPPSLGPVRITLHISDSITQAAFVSPILSCARQLKTPCPNSSSSSPKRASHWAKRASMTNQAANKALSNTRHPRVHHAANPYSRWMVAAPPAQARYRPLCGRLLVRPMPW